MDSLTLNRAFQYVDDKYLDIVEQERVLKASRIGSHAGSRHGWIAACIVGLILILGLPAVAIAANWFGLRDLLIGPVTEDIPTTENSSASENLSASEPQLISISGFPDSPQAQAQAEWQEFLNSYDPDANPDAAEADMRFGRYDVYNQEMGDKLEEIARKYGLELYTELNIVSQEELSYRLGGEFMGEKLKCAVAYLYDDGTFGCDGEAKLDDGRVVPFQVLRTVKRTLVERRVLLNIGNISDYREIPYVTSEGEMISLALSSYGAVIFADFEDCFFFVALSEWGDPGLTEENLKEIAEAIDFSVIKEVKKPDMRGNSVPEGGFTKLRPLQPEGECSNLGFGWLYLAVPDQPEQDYKVCFTKSDNREEDFDELDLNPEEADFIFPDVRENNAAIGEFVEHWAYTTFTTQNGDVGMMIVALYEKDGIQSYDTRIYQAVKGGYGYEVNEELTRELNEAYHSAEKQYPVKKVLESLQNRKSLNEYGAMESPVINVMKTKMLAYGNFGGNLGQGWLFLALPDGEKCDYQLCFVRSEDEDDRYKPLEDVLTEVEKVDYVFPDVRDGNTPIGKFAELYLYETFAADEKSGMILVAIYEADDDRYYDTRVYTEDDGGYGYAVNEFMTAELNQKYHNAEEDYPIWRVLAMPTD